jgi:hypothetical protein
MGEFTHAMRNPIRERDERIAALEAEVAALKARLAGIDSRDPRDPKCKNLDCALCHGIPASTGPR